MYYQKKIGFALNHSKLKKSKDIIFTESFNIYAFQLLMR